MVVSKMLGMKMVKLLSVIPQCVHCCHHNLKKCLHVTRSCVDVNATFLLKVYIHHCYPGVIGIGKNWSIKAKMLKSEGLARKHIIYTTYKNTVMPHGRHIYAKASDVAKAKICTYPQSDHALPHCKCVLYCSADCPCINIPDQEKK